MSDTAANAAEAEGWSVIEAAVSLAGERLGDRLVAGYAIGSLAHGGFSPAVSDVDLGLITRDLEPDDAQIVVEITAEIAHTHPLGSRLSVFYAPLSQFSDPPPEARFPPIDRFDLIRYGILVYGKDLRAAHQITLPTAAEIRGQAVNSALARVTAAQIAEDLRQLKAGGVSVQDATKLVLWPVRLQHVCDLGEATGNSDAVAHYLALPDAAHSELVRDALSWRELAVVPDPEDAIRRITNEICSLHAEVLIRVSGRADVPRRDELAERGSELAQVNLNRPLTGTCNCGAVAFEITAPLVSSTYCHCTRCQRRTGTGASANARVPADGFHIKHGAKTLRSWAPADGAEKFFCGNCGSAMFSRGDDPWVGVRLGVIDGDPGIRPAAHQYVQYAAIWEELPDDGLPRHQHSARQHCT